MRLLSIEQFKTYLSSLKVTRKVKLIQLHHTWSPNYSHFNGSNHLSLQKNMKTYHTKTNGWSDIGQHFTIFPDGLVCTGRDINVNPAGIYGANTGAICIECLGNFDVGGDNMTEAQREAIVAVTKMLLDKFNLKAEDNVTYHAWWTSSGGDLGDYYKGKSAKTCPGTAFFGGNTLTAYENNLMPLIKAYGKEEKKMPEIYNNINEVPEWGKPTIQKLVDKGYLKGDEKGNLNMSMDMLRILVINDRAGIYDMG